MKVNETQEMFVECKKKIWLFVWNFSKIIVAMK